ncbi:hypothetical protein C8F04DRAFT_1065636 [Mycena alexandri]|uniref:Calcineurin-like phosphoesterase domain-containing protein n=1 Tax=Mycena alexandri TaxID=1745969 RepID=A0AAD6TFI1_9AGAR|nr:hypothetical protein C8F04DRAFT_1065636 [Mycena alexandri]
MGVSERRKFKATNRFSQTILSSRTVVINGIRLGWVVVLVWGELGIYFWSLSSCKWPETAEWRRAKPTHVLLISDPQVRHPSVVWSESSWFKSLGQFLYEANLKRSWHVTRRLNPHAVFFLGDMLSSGKYVRSEAEYKAYWRKFQSIFPPESSFPQYFLPGNNDVGMGLAHSSPKNVRLYYSSIVGPFNRQVVIRDHTFICLDAPSLVDEDYQRSASGTGYEWWSPIPGGAVEFVKSVLPATFEKSSPSALFPGSRPTILLSHIPLARPDTAGCGPLREKGTIRRGVGHGYQNTLGKQTTTFLLKTLRPSVIFSGDNRDYCEYHHPLAVPDREVEEDTLSIREITVKSFSMSNHIRRPGFQLLSLIDPTPSGKSFMDAPCLLPDPHGIYTSLYMPLAFLTLIFLFIFNSYRSRRLRSLPLGSISLPPPNSGLAPLHPGADVWSPYTPTLPVSPRSTLPTSLRTPNAAAGPTMRAASRPDTPLASPLLGPPVIFHHHQEEEEEDTLYPTQYAQRNGNVSDGEEWPARGDDPAPSYFLPAASGNNLKQAAPRGWAWAWSWTFVFRGRRRRMTVSVPSWNSLRELGAQLGGDGDMVLRRRGVAWSTARDGLGILWPTLSVWVLCAWWMF